MQATCSGLDWMSCIAHMGYPICGWPKLIKKKKCIQLTCKIFKGEPHWRLKLAWKIVQTFFFYQSALFGSVNIKAVKEKLFCFKLELLAVAMLVHSLPMKNSWLNCDQVCQICWPCLWHHWYRLLSTNRQHLWSHFPWLSNINSLTNKKSIPIDSTQDGPSVRFPFNTQSSVMVLLGRKTVHQTTCRSLRCLWHTLLNAEGEWGQRGLFKGRKWKARIAGEGTFDHSRLSAEKGSW